MTEPLIKIPMEALIANSRELFAIFVVVCGFGSFMDEARKWIIRAFLIISLLIATGFIQVV